MRNPVYRVKVSFDLIKFLFILNTNLAFVRLLQGGTLEWLTARHIVGFEARIDVQSWDDKIVKHPQDTRVLIVKQGVLSTHSKFDFANQFTEQELQVDDQCLGVHYSWYLYCNFQPVGNAKLGLIFSCLKWSFCVDTWLDRYFCMFTTFGPVVSMSMSY